jgi:protease-4
MGKRVYAYSDTYICSGAYWLGCTADKLYVSKSAITVNVGVYSVIIDTSKMYESMGVTVSVIKNKAGTYKAAGVDGTSLTQEQVAFEQAQVDYIADKFRGWVKAHRPQAKEQDLQGQDYYGAQAVELGLADKVSSYDEAVSEILGGF